MFLVEAARRYGIIHMIDWIFLESFKNSRFPSSRQFCQFNLKLSALCYHFTAATQVRLSTSTSSWRTTLTTTSWQRAPTLLSSLSTSTMAAVLTTTSTAITVTANTAPIRLKTSDEISLNLTRASISLQSPTKSSHIPLSKRATPLAPMPTYNSLSPHTPSTQLSYKSTKSKIWPRKFQPPRMKMTQARTSHPRTLTRLWPTTSKILSIETTYQTLARRITSLRQPTKSIILQAIPSTSSRPQPSGTYWTKHRSNGSTTFGPTSFINTVNNRSNSSLNFKFQTNLFIIVFVTAVGVAIILCITIVMVIRRKKRLLVNSYHQNEV